MALFAQFFAAAAVGADPVAALLACALAVDLKLHSAAETATLYPVLLNKLGPGGAALAQRALAEHAMVEASFSCVLGRPVEAVNNILETYQPTNQPLITDHSQTATRRRA